MGARGPKPGTVKRAPNAGRKAGTPNKRTQELREEMKRFLKKRKLGHPVIEMLKIAAGITRMKTAVYRGKETGTIYENLQASPELRVKCWAETAQYMDSKLSAWRFVDKDGADREIPLPPSVDWGTLNKDAHVQVFLVERDAALKGKGAAKAKAAKPKRLEPPRLVD